MSEIKGTRRTCTEFKKTRANGLDLVQRINDERNANLKENEIELIQDRTHFAIRFTRYFKSFHPTYRPTYKEKY